MDYAACPGCGLVLFRAGACPRCGAGGSRLAVPQGLKKVLGGGLALSAIAIAIGIALGIKDGLSRAPSMPGTAHPAGAWTAPGGRWSADIRGAHWLDVDPSRIPAATSGMEWDLTLSNPEDTAFMIVGSAPLPPEARGATLNLDTAMDAIVRGYETKFEGLTSDQAPLSMKGTRRRSRRFEWTYKGQRVKSYLAIVVGGDRFFVVGTGARSGQWDARRFEFEQFLESFDCR